jgi:hypothetical protein
MNLRNDEPWLVNSSVPIKGKSEKIVNPIFSDEKLIIAYLTHIKALTNDFYDMKSFCTQKSIKPSKKYKKNPDNLKN